MSLSYVKAEVFMWSHEWFVVFGSSHIMLDELVVLELKAQEANQ